MPTVSDYIVVTAVDEEAQLKTGGDIDHQFTFSVPSNIDKSKNAVATYLLQVEGQTADAPPRNLLWRLLINGSEVDHHQHDANRFAAVQKVFGGSVLQVGRNHSTVTIKEGRGAINFSNFVIHIQVKDGSPRGDALPPGDGLPPGGGSTTG